MTEDFRIRVFLALVSEGSFTKASRVLGVSQPAVSQNITALEKDLGVQLFIRGRGEASLTSQGMAFLSYAKQISYWYTAAGNMFGDMGILTDGKPVTIHADPVVASCLLPEVIATISAAQPKLRFNIISGCRHPVGKDYYAPDNQNPVDVGLYILDSEDVMACNGTDMRPVILEENEPSGHSLHGQQSRRSGHALPEPDIRINVSPNPQSLDFVGDGNLLGVMDAAVVASVLNTSVANAVGETDEVLKTTQSGTVVLKSKPFSTIAGIPVSNRLAVWEGYRPFLTPDLEARTAIVSSSPRGICSIVEASSNIVGIVPAMTVTDGVLRLLVNLPEFAFDVHFEASPTCEPLPVCKALKSLVASALKH